MWCTLLTILLFGLICSALADFKRDKVYQYQTITKPIELLSISGPASLVSTQNVSPLQAGKTYDLRSKNYPFNYPSNTNSSSLFISPVGTNMTIECPDFNVPCPDFFTIAPTNESLVFGNATQYCTPNQTFTSITTPNNTLAISLYSGSRSFLNSLVLKYRLWCSIKVSESNSDIGSIATNESCTCGIRNSNNASSTRIVGGTETSRGEIPWRVLLNIRVSLIGPSIMCGGTIISPNWVMTAAHCTSNLLFGYEIEVIVGAQQSTNDGKAVLSDYYVQYPAFNRKTMEGDMTLVHLSTPLTFDNYSISSACLPWNMQNDTFDNVTALASGWGTTQPVPAGQVNAGTPAKSLMEVELPVLSTEHCQQQFPKLDYITSFMLCTYLPGKDTCQGDSGGSIDYQPAVNGSYFSIGVVSFGEGCAQEDYPGVYSKVTKFLDWIKLTTTGESYCNPSTN